MSKNISELSARQGLKNNLFENLTKPDLDKKKIAKEFLIGKSSVTGTMSFYDFLRDENKGKKVYVCNGSACLCAGTQEKLTQQLSKHFEKDEIGHMTCLGRCHENSAFNYEGKNYSALTEQQLDEVINNDLSSLNNDHYHTRALGDKILTDTALTAEQMVGAFKKVFNQDIAATLNEIKTSQLRGRGGAGFPIGFKLESAMKEQAEEKYIICNADEGDPGAYSDRYLLEKQPYSVLFGMIVSAYIVGAQYGVLYIRAEYPESIKIIDTAIKSLEPHLEKIDFDFDFTFKIICAQGAYICGEETALINSIEGQRPEVRTRPPFPTQQGLFNKPTVVNNVETLASIFYILENGGQKYSELGHELSTGTKLVSLDSFFNNPGIYEVEMGTPLNDVFEKLGGGFRKPIKAVHIGGPLGGVVPVSEFKELNISFESFSSHGFLLGHASVVCIPKDFAMVEYIHHLFEFAAYESCGKCFPCRLGTKRGEELFSKAINNNQMIDKTLLNDLLDTLEQGSLCAHGGGIPLPVKNTLNYFADELESYFA